MSQHPPLPRPTAVVFDLDGTLIDSRADLATAVNRTRADYDLPPLTLDTVVGMVGEGARTLVRRALEARSPARASRRAGADPEVPSPEPGDRRAADPGAPSPEPRARAVDPLEPAFARFLAHYREVCLETTRPYPGIEALLKRLAERFPLGVLTNKPEALTRRILRGLGLSPRFSALVGGDTLASRKPDPAGLLHLAGELGARPEAALLVGDSAVDAATARAGGCPFALVQWGFATAEERAALDADLRFTDAGELGEFLLGRPE